MSEVMKISIDRREKRIEVNDAGEYIVFPLGDQAFIPKMLDLLSDFEKSAQQRRARRRQWQIRSSTI